MRRKVGGSNLFVFQRVQLRLNPVGSPSHLSQKGFGTPHYHGFKSALRPVQRHGNPKSRNGAAEEWHITSQPRLLQLDDYQSHRVTQSPPRGLNLGESFLSLSYTSNQDSTLRYSTFLLGLFETISNKKPTLKPSPYYLWPFAQKATWSYTR